MQRPYFLNDTQVICNSFAYKLFCSIKCKKQLKLFNIVTMETGVASWKLNVLQEGGRQRGAWRDDDWQGERAGPKQY